jgi:hypothetical protein
VPIDVTRHGRSHAVARWCGLLAATLIRWWLFTRDRVSALGRIFVWVLALIVVLTAACAGNLAAMP